VAARQASHGLLVICDADMMMSSDALARAMLACRDHFDAVNPYSHLIDLDEAETRAILAGQASPGDFRRAAALDRRREGEHLCFCGGICVFRRETYFALGGMDERFLGWGGEDDAMSVNLERYTERIAVQKDTLAYHLWHPRSPRRYAHPHYRDNLALANDYRRCEPQALARWRAAQRASMGDPNKYRPA